MTSIRSNKWFMAFLYVLVFLLLAEWLTPVIELSDTGFKFLFLLFVGLALLMSLMKVPWQISGPIKILYIFWFVVIAYTDSVFFNSEAMAFLWADITANVSALASQNWGQTTDVFRTVLFFTLLWMAVYLIHYWVSFRLSIFLFYLLTVIFIAILDTFSPYSGDGAIIRIMVIGLLLAGLLHFARWVERNQISIRTDKIVLYVIPLFLMIAGSASLAMYLPKAEPQWPDPVPYITSFSGQGGSGSGGGAATIGRIGYGVDDSQLGGSFVGDDTPVFRAEMETGQYWKVESKDTYTTKGWELTEEADQPTIYSNGDRVETDFTPGDDESRETGSVGMEQSFPFVLYPYGVESFQMDGESVEYEYNPTDQRFETFRQGNPFEPQEYEVNYSVPSYSLTELRATSEEELEELSAEFDRYLQLPDELPQRVRDLAEEITENSVSLYDKTRAIERYFSQDGFEYSQTDIPVPEENQDYVDQFLFETKRGYCDNFSTSMVVMLRSIDIPARWVKGFTEGELLNTSGDADVYQVTNNNAHSWVEAYMPGVGWMLFEPTIGFSGASDIDFDLDVDAADTEEQELPEPLDPTESEGMETEEAAAAAGGPSSWDRFQGFLSDHSTKIFWVTAGVLAVGLLLFKARQKWMPKMFISYYRLRGNSQSFEKAYLRLLKQLDLYGLKRKDGQTLKAYASYIDSFFGGGDMKRLTLAYEESVYGGNRNSIEWNELKESWENLINRTSG